MSRERFTERQGGVRKRAARQIYQHIVPDRAPRLSAMAKTIQSLTWD